MSHLIFFQSVLCFQDLSMPIHVDLGLLFLTLAIIPSYAYDTIHFSFKLYWTFGLFPYFF